MPLVSGDNTKETCLGKVMRLSGWAWLWSWAVCFCWLPPPVCLLQAWSVELRRGRLALHPVCEADILSELSIWKSSNLSSFGTHCIFFKDWILPQASITFTPKMNSLFLGCERFSLLQVKQDFGMKFIAGRNRNLKWKDYMSSFSLFVLPFVYSPQEREIFEILHCKMSLK